MIRIFTDTRDNKYMSALREVVEKSELTEDDEDYMIIEMIDDLEQYVSSQDTLIALLKNPRHPEIATLEYQMIPWELFESDDPVVIEEQIDRLTNVITG